MTKDETGGDAQDWGVSSSEVMVNVVWLIKVVSKYMRWPAIRYLYGELTESSPEHAVDTLWMNLLRLYFKVENDFTITPHARPNGDFPAESRHCRRTC